MISWILLRMMTIILTAKSTEFIKTTRDQRLYVNAIILCRMDNYLCTVLFSMCRVRVSRIRVRISISTDTKRRLS